MALILSMLPAGGCSSTPSDTEKRLGVLENEVKALRSEARTSEKSLREELALIRTNLATIRSLLELERDRSEAVAPPAKSEDSAKGKESESDRLDRELDAKAKGFVKENLDRLLAITRKLLDKMEHELDKQETTSPKPEGDEI